MNDSKHRIVFKDSNGNTLTEADLREATGIVKWELVGRDNVSEAAIKLHQKGREIGSRGNHNEALQLFKEASTLAPDWPYPVYDAAFTYLMQGDAKTALEYYELVDSLAPRGYFTVKTAIHTLRGENAGLYPKGLYLSYIQLEWWTDPIQKKKKVMSIIEVAPDYAPAWKELAVLEADDKKFINAIDKGLSLNPDLETKGNLLINKAIYFSNSNRLDESKEILGKLIMDRKTTIGVREGAKFVLSQIIGTNN